MPSTAQHATRNTEHANVSPPSSALRPPSSDNCPLPSVPKPRLVYLLAASHSGSTLLAMLLGAHSQLATVGELKATSLGDPDRYRCSCRSLLKDCSFWQRLHEAMAARGIRDFSVLRAGTSVHEIEDRYVRRLLSPLLRGAALEFVRDTALACSGNWRRHLRECQRRNLALVQSLHSITGAEWVVDSSKVALRLKYLLALPDLEIKVIRVLRDGRAVALTYLDDANFADAADPALRRGGSGDHRPSVRNNMSEAAREWRRSNEAADNLLARLPRSQWVEVRYESLCANPRSVLESLCCFLGVDPANINLEFRASTQHVIGNGMRFDSSSEIRLDERWRTHLTAAQLQEFDRVAGDLNRKYGYT